MTADELELVDLHRSTVAAFAAGDPAHPRALLRLRELFARFGFTPASRAVPSDVLRSALAVDTGQRAE